MSFEVPQPVFSILERDEKLIIGAKTWAVIQKPEYAFLTDRRVLYFNQKLMGRYELKTIPYSKLLEMKANTGRLMYGELEFTSEEGGVIKLENVPNDQIEPFIQALENSINRIAVEPITITKVKGLAEKMEWEFKKPAEIIFKTRPPEDEDLSQEPGKEDPLTTLKIRFARGEITKDEFLEMKKLLEQ